jgi:hypothetical protein
MNGAGFSLDGLMMRAKTARFVSASARKSLSIQDTIEIPSSWFVTSSVLLLLSFGCRWRYCCHLPSMNPGFVMQAANPLGNGQKTVLALTFCFFGAVQVVNRVILVQMKFLCSLSIEVEIRLQTSESITLFPSDFEE